MKFLIISSPGYPVPLEIGLGLTEAMEAWLAEHRTSGALEAAWGFAGKNGGGGILNVGSIEELDAIMGSYPYGQFSDTEVIALSDLDSRLKRQKVFFQSMAQG